MTRTNRMPKHMAARKPGYGTKAKAAIVAGTMALAISPSMAFAFPAQPGMGGEQPQMNQSFAGDQQAVQGEQQMPQFNQQAPQGEQAPAGGQGEFGPNQQMPGQAGQLPADGAGAPDGTSAQPAGQLPAFGQQGAANGFDGMIRQVIKHVAQAFDMQLDDDKLDEIFQSISQQFAVEPGQREATPFANAALSQPGMQSGTEQAPKTNGAQEAPAWAANEQRPSMPGNMNQFQLSGGQRPTMPDMGQQVPSGEQISIA